MRAIRDVYGVEGELGDYIFHGRTDPGIIRDLADLWGRPTPRRSSAATRARRSRRWCTTWRSQLGTSADLIDARVDECIEHYVELLRGEIDARRVEVLPGSEGARHGARR